MNSLQAVDFVDSSNRPLDGLMAIRSTKAASPDERAVLLQAKAFEYIDYVYFRRFKSASGDTVRSSQVAAYIVDNSRQKLTRDQLASLHHKLWLHAVAPLVYVAWPTQVDILSCARAPDFWDINGVVPRDRYSPAETIQTAATISDQLARKKRQRCSAYRLANGTFWDDPENQKLARDDAAAHRSLIQAIVEADRKLGGPRKPLRRRLLVLMVLIKYLEDREVFPSGLFGRFHTGARSILDVLSEGTVEEVTRLLRYFEKRFNGDVFSLGDDEVRLTATELKHVARLVEGKTLGDQIHFWELFQFEHIPVEVISRLYQRFVTGHGAVYTPPFLAALLLDQVMPFDSMTGEETVLDPACGSGVFLVGAFKRLVTYWRSRHQWKNPSADDLKAILSQSIHGIEMEPTAVDLTAFSLALAICDALDPPVIWNKLKFDKLRGRNLREGDFFDPATVADSNGHTWPEKFDVVVGNPPFKSELTSAAKAVDRARPKSEPKLPDRQVAYLFLERSMRLLSPGGSVCLIQPHGLLYNSNPAKFRRHLMSLARLDTILDFISIRGMFDEKDPKTVAWHAIQDDSRDKPVNHLTFRRTYLVSERISFEIDHYDWHEITHQQAMDDPFVWRINLLGGGRLRDVSERLLKFRTLTQVATSRGWDYGEGYIAGKKGQRTPAPFLTGMRLLPSRAFTKNGISRSQLGDETVHETLFKSHYTVSRFSPPLLLIKAHESLPVEYWDDGPIAYRDKILGIHASDNDAKQLQRLGKFFKLHRSTLQFCCVLHGTQALTGKATVPLKQDIDRLPIPDDLTDLDFCFWEDVLKDDVLKYMADYVRLGQGSKLLKQETKPDDVREYSAFYVLMLGSLYRNLKAADSVRLNGLIAQPFYFGKSPDVSWLGDNCENALHRLVYEKTGDSLRTVRVVRYYDGNVILVVKPDRLRYWIRSTAIRDADDTLIDLRERGW